MAKNKKLSVAVEPEVVAVTPKKRGRPRKIKTDTEAAKPKLSLAQKQEIKLKKQKERNAAKAGVEPANKERFYCKNKDLTAELEKWRDSNKAEEDALYAEYLKSHTTEESQKKDPFKIDYSRRTISEELGRMIIAVGERMLNRSEFRNYTKELKEDMLGMFELKLIKGLKNYNFKFNNPFAFFTTAAWNAFLTVIGKHYKQQNIKKDLMSKLAQELETYTGINPASSLSKCIKSYLGNDVEVE